jgi:hypothetical protein
VNPHSWLHFDVTGRSRRGAARCVARPC